MEKKIVVFSGYLECHLVLEKILKQKNKDLSSVRHGSCRGGLRGYETGLS